MYLAPEALFNNGACVAFWGCRGVGSCTDLLHPIINTERDTPNTCNRREEYFLKDPANKILYIILQFWNDEKNRGLQRMWGKNLK